MLVARDFGAKPAAIAAAFGVTDTAGVARGVAKAEKHVRLYPWAAAKAEEVSALAKDLAEVSC